MGRLAALLLALVLMLWAAPVSAQGAIGEPAATEMGAEGDFVAVTGIEGAPDAATVDVPLTLAGAVVPGDASATDIVWSVADAGETGAVIAEDGITFTASAEGTAKVTATIAGGIADGGEAYAQEFEIIVGIAPFVAVAEIADAPTAATVKTPLVLSAAALPENATNREITWSIAEPGEDTADAVAATVAQGEGGAYTLTADAIGTVYLTATIENGLGEGESYTQRIAVPVKPMRPQTRAAAETASSFSELQAAITNVNDGGTITITQNIELTSTLSFDLNNRHITITSSAGQQYTLKRANSFTTGPILHFPDDNNDNSGLTLTNIIIDGNGAVDGSSVDDQWSGILYINGGYTVTLGEGSVLQNNNINPGSSNPSVAFCKDSTLVLAGGTIQNNSTPGIGIIYLTNSNPPAAGSKFKMSSGTITGNTCVGGAIYSNARRGVEITGGEISNNTGGAFYILGGGLAISPSATVTTSISGKIIGNDASGGLAATVNLKRYATGAVVSTATAAADGTYTLSNIPVAANEDDAYVIEAAMTDYLTKTSSRFSLYGTSVSTNANLTLNKFSLASNANLTVNGTAMITGGTVVNGNVNGDTGTAVFNTSTLTLTGYTGGAIVAENMDVNLVLAGANVIDTSGVSNTPCIKMMTAYRTLTISGSGSLKATSSGIAAFDISHCTLDIQSGTLEIASDANNAINAGTATGGVTINGYTVTLSASANTNASGGGLGAIRAWALTVNGSPPLIMEGDSAASTTVAQLSFASNVTKKHIYIGPVKLPANMNLTVNGSPLITAGQVMAASVSGSTGTAAFDTTSNTLTLTGYTGGAVVAQNFNLNVVLVGDSNITGASDDAIEVTGGGLVISGGGSLTAAASGQFVNALSASGGNITLNGGTITLSASGSDGHSILSSGGFTINGNAATLTATGGPMGALCVGTTVSVTGGTIKEGNNAAGAQAVPSLTLTGGGTKYSKPYVSIAPSLAANADLRVNGVYLVQGGVKTVNTVSGATYDLASNTLTLNGYSGTGIRATNMNLNIALIATNTVNSSGDYGIIAVNNTGGDNSVTISGSGNLTVNHNGFTALSVCIQGTGGVNIQSGTVAVNAVIGGAYQYAYGIHAGAKPINIDVANGASVTAAASGGNTGNFALFGQSININGTATIREGNSAPGTVVGTLTLGDFTYSATPVKTSAPYVSITPAGASTYTLSVVNGTDNTASGPYTAGTPVSITANAPAPGKEFERWTTSGGGSFASATSATTTFTMPAANVTVTATYKDLPVPAITGLAASPDLLVHGGGTSTITVAGNNLSGQTVTVTAFDGATPTAITTNRSGAGTVTLNFPANASLTDDKVYTIKASLDGGGTWATATATVTVLKNAPSYADPAKDSITKGGGITGSGTAADPFVHM